MDEKGGAAMEDGAMEHGAVEDGAMESGPEVERPRISGARWRLIGVLTALFAAMLLYKVLHAGHLEQTALFYVGVPAVIALTVALACRPQTVTGTAMASVTIGLALAGPLLNEGVICLVTAAPLFYAMAAAIGLSADAARRERRGGRAHAFVTVPLVGLLALEGAGAYELPRDNAVSVTRTVAVSPEAYERALAAPPRFDAPEPLFLRIPFPRPQRATGHGLDVGDTREITFNPRKALGIGAHPTPRSMRLVVAERAPGRVVFDVERDTTLARWLELRSAEVRWRQTLDGRTEVTWRLRYRRTFDPGWYFGPIQSYAMKQAACYLSDTFAQSAKAEPAGRTTGAGQAAGGAR
ncbi:hypothetical protein [Streptomyces sp. XD-27]|uniref:hypothetical protein n=1 Tax=Streptomyces sp. XD-27 TaxID=3062779 RepID=UPI0026F47AB6|nr:hypothetical protein [Streptomyces sp. XD-27]WKX70427.1 hypothetical protein Q3Y56_11275 [Streptomyces sp. XD-27]